MYPNEHVYLEIACLERAMPVQTVHGKHPLHKPTAWLNVHVKCYGNAMQGVVDSHCWGQAHARSQQLQQATATLTVCSCTFNDTAGCHLVPISSAL